MKSIFKVTCANTKLSYIVVSQNSHEAYKKVRQMLDNCDIGFSDGRQLAKIEVLATKYPDDDYDDIYELLDKNKEW